jgi:mono/diheme cytochrome c family protein
LRFVAAILFLATLAACSSLIPPPTPTRSPLEIRGRGVFESYCSRCHGTVGETVIVGPSLAGIATRGNERVEGMDAQTYIRISILNPSAYTVEGFPEGIMPLTLKDELAAEDLEAVIVYLLTLK